jgi:hypothetical protein
MGQLWQSPRFAIAEPEILLKPFEDIVFLDKHGSSQVMWGKSLVVRRKFTAFEVFSSTVCMILAYKRRNQGGRANYTLTPIFLENQH